MLLVLVLGRKRAWMVGKRRKTREISHSKPPGGNVKHKLLYQQHNEYRERRESNYICVYDR